MFDFNEASELVGKAIAVATEAHAGVTRKYSGEPYIVHPLRVSIRAAAINDYPILSHDIILSAILHDVVEDTDVSLQDLRDHGFPEDVVEAVDALSRRPDEKYSDFVNRAKQNITARIVKLADVMDNLSDLPASSSVRDRYEMAIEVLRLDR